MKTCVRALQPCELPRRDRVLEAARRLNAEGETVDQYNLRVWGIHADCFDCQTMTHCDRHPTPEDSDGTT